MRLLYRRKGKPRKPLPPLLGPKVPRDFVDNGCGAIGSRIGNGWWSWACRIHDYEYHLIRAEPSPVLRHFDRRVADEHLEENIRRLSQGRFARRRIGFLIARAYYRIVRGFGGLTIGNS